MINFDDYTNKNKTKHNKSCPYIPDHPAIGTLRYSLTGPTAATQGSHNHLAVLKTQFNT